MAALTHDLRTPLTVAKLSAVSLVRKFDDPKSIQLVSGRIISSMDRLDHMIQDLLDANRIKAGEQLPLDIEECNLNEIVLEPYSTWRRYMGRGSPKPWMHQSVATGTQKASEE